MFDYLQQFNKLTKELRERVSSPAFLEILSSLENKYNLSLAMLVMQVMIKQIAVKDLPSYFIAEIGLPADKAENLSKELQERIFFSVATYLGIKILPPLSPEEKDLQLLMKNAGIVLPSQELMVRCRQILLTYRKGVRTKIDTRAALERQPAQGGLGLEPTAADRLLSALDRPTALTETPSQPQAGSALTELINKNTVAAAYDLKSALASGQVKAPESLANKFKPTVQALDVEHELAAPAKILDLPAPEKVLDLPAPSQSSPVKPKAVVADSVSTVITAVKPTIAQPVIINTEKEDISQAGRIATDNKIQAASPSLSAQEVAAELKPIIAPEASFKPKSGSDKKAVAPTETNQASFKPSSAAVASAGLWSKLFKHKLPKPELNVTAVEMTGSQSLEAAVKAATKNATTISRPAASTEARPKMEDVRLRPKIMGPLEELRFLDLVNFRRLGGSPKEITNKLVMKIKLLEKDGYDRMVEGVSAWRQSPVNRIYVRLVQEAAMKGVVLRTVIESRQAENKETLSMEEIEAIMAMNNQLMF